MFCSCANSYVVEILMYETPTKTWAEVVIKAHNLRIQLVSWWCFYNFSTHYVVGVFCINISTAQKQNI